MKTLLGNDINYDAVNSPAENWIIVDIETVPRDDISHLLPEPSAPGNIKDPEKIAAAIAQKKLEQLPRAGLDNCLNRIVALGYISSEMSDRTPRVLTSENDIWEEHSLNQFWSEYKMNKFEPGKTLIGFHIRGFDLPVMLQRTRLLGMPLPNLDYGKFSRSIRDIAEDLAFGDPKWEGGAQVMSRSLKSYCSLFDIDVPDDDSDGSEIGGLYMAQDWDAIDHHCHRDVERTYKLAQRLGVVR